jgi:hypothetical protein
MQFLASRDGDIGGETARLSVTSLSRQDGGVLRIERRTESVFLVLSFLSETEDATSTDEQSDDDHDDAEDTSEQQPPEESSGAEHTEAETSEDTPDTTASEDEADTGSGDEEGETGSSPSSDRPDAPEEDVLGEFNDSVSLGLAGEEYISFRPGWSVSPNKHLSTRRFDGYEFVVFLFDKDDETLYMKPLTAGEADTLREHRADVKINSLTFDNRGSVSPISIREVVKQWGLDDYLQEEPSTRYYPDWDVEREAVAIDITADPEVYERNSGSSDADEQPDADE